MKKFFISMLCISALLLACASTDTVQTPYVEVPDCRPNLHFTADDTFTAEERYKIVAAMNDWREFSGGRIQMSVEFTTATYNDHHIVKMTSQDPYIIYANEAMAKQYNLPNWHYWGLSNDDHMVYLIVDLIPKRLFQSTVTHELGHQAGLFITDCNRPLAKDCVHSIDPYSLMCGFPESSDCKGSDHLTEGDKAFCRASCQCD